MSAGFGRRQLAVFCLGAFDCCGPSALALRPI